MSLKKNTYSLLKKDQKNYLIFIFILIIFTTLLETLSIASFYPLLDLIITSNNSQETPNTKNLFRFFDYE